RHPFGVRNAGFSPAFKFDGNLICNSPAGNPLYFVIRFIYLNACSSIIRSDRLAHKSWRSCERRPTPLAELVETDNSGGSMKRILLVSVCVCVCLAMPAFGQSSNARLSGTVNDASGAVLPGVEVKATNNATGVVATAITNDAGAY